MKTNTIVGPAAAVVFLLWFGIFVTSLAAWITHVAVAVQYLVGEAAVATGYTILLALGVFVPPVGVVHGIGIWFGAW